jgi:hypothetical protein
MYVHTYMHDTLFLACIIRCNSFLKMIPHHHNWNRYKSHLTHSLKMIWKAYENISEHFLRRKIYDMGDVNGPLLFTFGESIFRYFDGLEWIFARKIWAICPKGPLNPFQAVSHHFGDKKLLKQSFFQTPHIYAQKCISARTVAMLLCTYVPILPYSNKRVNFLRFVQIFGEKIGVFF